MKKVLGALAIVAVLGACGLIKTTVNYADGKAGKDDPIGLKGKKAVTVSLLGKNGVQLQASKVSDPFTGTFADLDISQVPSGVNLSEWGFGVSLTVPSGGVMLGGTNCPASVTISNVTATASLKNTSDSGTGVNLPVIFEPNSATFTETATDCVYAAPSAPINLKATLSGATLTSVLSIATTGGNNTITGTISFDYPDAIVGRSLSLEFGAGTGYFVAGL
jgi:hypothetical protein